MEAFSGRSLIPLNQKHLWLIGVKDSAHFHALSEAPSVSEKRVDAKLMFTR